MKKLLPLGSIVLLKDSQRRLMVTARCQRDADETESEKLWDYAGCLYPEGNPSSEQVFLFDTDQIERLFFIGFQDEEEVLFQEYLVREAPEFMEVDEPEEQAIAGL